MRIIILIVGDARCRILFRTRGDHAGFAPTVLHYFVVDLKQTHDIAIFINIDFERGGFCA